MKQTLREPKSIKLPIDMLEWLRGYRTRFTSEVDCGLAIGIDRLVVNRVLIVGSCSPKSFKKIEKTFKKESATATAA